jgi:hypothetical protein
MIIIVAMLVFEVRALHLCPWEQSDNGQVIGSYAVSGFITSLSSNQPRVQTVNKYQMFRSNDYQRNDIINTAFMCTKINLIRSIIIVIAMDTSSQCGT